MGIWNLAAVHDSLNDPKVVSVGLRLYLDAANAASYSGSGTAWNDLSGNSYHFTLTAASAYTASPTPHMNFENTDARRNSDVPVTANSTLMVWSSIKASTADWRTLLRGLSNDHHVIIAAGSNTLGMYDNNAAGFVSSGFDVTNLPNYSSQFNCLTWRFSDQSPYYKFSFNNGSTTYDSTNAAAIQNNGFGYIGGVGQQYWGKIAVLLYYSRILTDSEISNNYGFFRSRFGLP